MGQPEGKAAYQIIIHPSISILRRCLFLLLLLSLLFLLPAVTIGLQSASGLGPYRCAHTFIVVLHNIY